MNRLCKILSKNKNLSFSSLKHRSIFNVAMTTTKIDFEDEYVQGSTQERVRKILKIVLVFTASVKESQRFHWVYLLSYLGQCYMINTPQVVSHSAF